MLLGGRDIPEPERIRYGLANSKNSEQSVILLDKAGYLMHRRGVHRLPIEEDLEWRIAMNQNVGNN